MPRNLTPAEIVGAIEAVAAGLYVFHPSDVDSVPMLRPREAEIAPDLAPPLSQQERGRLADPAGRAGDDHPPCIGDLASHATPAAAHCSDGR